MTTISGLGVFQKMTLNSLVTADALYLSDDGTELLPQYIAHNCVNREVRCTGKTWFRPEYKAKFDVFPPSSLLLFKAMLAGVVTYSPETKEVKISGEVHKITQFIGDMPVLPDELVFKIQDLLK